MFILKIACSIRIHLRHTSLLFPSVSGSNVGKLINVTVTPCDTKPCSLYRGEKAKVSITFQTNHPVKKGSSVVHGIIAHVPVPFPLDNDDLCTFTQPGCPISSESTAVYSYELPVLDIYPTVSYPNTLVSVRVVRFYQHG
ncbi:Epididymal secretory protein E1 [Fasciolopsis buskii]|uniref:Epididymal secretory protein E1 n=1 Tax=Fasciolopsis buskii TaxID=27845 RepID=A0A8E0RMX5_9TREM|nr:Epididymal secretory protein E1 [Fasciolopsis buski]